MIPLHLIWNPSRDCSIPLSPPPFATDLAIINGKYDILLELLLVAASKMTYLSALSIGRKARHP